MTAIEPGPREHTEPLAVYDVRDPSWPDQPITEIGEWLRKQGVDPDDTYRFEVHLIDCLFARIFQYYRDENGRVYCPRDHSHALFETCEIARRDPFDVPISEMPPARGAA